MPMDSASNDKINFLDEMPSEKKEISSSIGGSSFKQISERSDGEEEEEEEVSLLQRCLILIRESLL